MSTHDLLVEDICVICGEPSTSVIFEFFVCHDHFMWIAEISKAYGNEFDKLGVPGYMDRKKEFISRAIIYHRFNRFVTYKIDYVHLRNTL
jgi:hypothetical protein